LSNAFDFKGQFAKIKPQTEPKPAPATETLKLDAIADKHEFVSREPATRVKRERVRNQTGPIEVLSVKGPLDVMNRFKDYCNAQGHSSYWQAIDALLRKAGG
jgi:hypothetical protein